LLRVNLRQIPDQLPPTVGCVGNFAFYDFHVKRGSVAHTERLHALLNTDRGWSQKLQR